MEYKKTPTAAEIVRSIDAILKKEHKLGVRLKFLFGLLKALEEPQKLRTAVLQHTERLIE